MLRWLSLNQLSVARRVLITPFSISSISSSTLRVSQSEPSMRISNLPASKTIKYHAQLQLPGKLKVMMGFLQVYNNLLDFKRLHLTNTIWEWLSSND
ncbi:hypothetical protein L596_021107 [Steinernema carpocapsae]|uniref:Uncharacterized protein n=1 Tax=Steinernema carpocapsae TaxID=34508 RepID=A0A4U5MVI3_STECR|nr:hypothetical protein L596_021107 [Steinernema carpocapsae]